MSESSTPSESSEPVVGLPVADTSRPIAIYPALGVSEYRIGPYQVMVHDGIVVAFFRNPCW